MARRHEGLLNLPNTLLSGIIDIVADRDVEARGDLLALSATWRLVRSLMYGHVKEFLKVRNRHRSKGGSLSCYRYCMISMRERAPIGMYGLFMSEI